MNRHSFFKTRLVHILVLTVFVAIAMFPPIRALVPVWDLVLAIGFLVAWMLGQRYEREIIVEAGLADRHDVLEVERRSMNLTDRESGPDR